MSNGCNARAAAASLSLPVSPCVLALALCLAPAARADDLIFQPRVSIGVQTYRIGVEDIIVPVVPTATNNSQIVFRDGFSVQDQLKFLGAGFTVSKGRWFADLSGQWSGKGQDQTNQFQGQDAPAGSPAGGSGSIGHDHTIDSEFDRREENFTVGYGLTSSVSVYLGYKHSLVHVDNTTLPVVSPAPQPGDVLLIGVRKIEFSYNGAFVGATYSIPFESVGGSLSFQSSLAQLKGDFGFRFVGNVFKVTNALQLAPLDPAFYSGNTPGKSLGVNIGISWTQGLGNLSPHLDRVSYTFGIDRSQYDFDADQANTANFKERNTRLRLDLRYRFGSGGGD